MLNVIYLIVTLSLLAPSIVLAQEVSYLAIPASSFTPRNSTTVKDPLRGTVETLGYTGNISGTARFFGDNDSMFAPVNLRHGSTVISLTCGGMAPTPRVKIHYILRRNEPQQANVDMAGVAAKTGLTNFQTSSTNSIKEPVIDNKRFNYYIVATLLATNDIQECRTCSINRCTIAYGYGLPQPAIAPPNVVK